VPSTATTSPPSRHDRTRDEVIAALTAPGARFEIAQEDVRGHRMSVFANRERSLTDLLVESARFDEREYLVHDGVRLTYGQHLAAVASLATALRDRYGIGPGDRVAILAVNCPEWVLTFWAVTALGAITVGMNSLWSPREVAYAITDTEPALMVTDARRRELLGEVGAMPVLSVEQDIADLIAAYPDVELPSVGVDEDDPVIILFTSGTTGRSKGAVSSHRNVLTAVYFHLLNDAVATELGAPPPRRRFLLSSPLFHIAGLHNLVVPRLVTGDTAVLYSGRFDVDRLLAMIEAEAITHWGAVPTMATRLVEHPDLLRYDLSSLRSMSLGSAPSSAELKQRIRAALPVAGQALGTSYGLTESSTAATLATPADLAQVGLSSGRPIPTMQLQIRNDHGQPVPDGIDGEIYLRGPQIVLGYWRNPEATAAASAEDGWFRTGDLGAIRDGHLIVASRRSDLIIRGGENVYPVEVENVINEHPAVSECLVIGRPDDDLGQQVTAVVVLQDGRRVSAEELTRFATARLARYKVPAQWTITRQPLPRNATGKVNRAQVTVDQ
jgi:acyl-CoA synthetase (AMP-forming)/AMP-acid ligase II